ncbi:MAG: hypothetical protein M3277_11645, partial [Actinomycetota bacterium]|nr:hypothetical protein [Actinomycetota bacterium]
MRHLLAGFGALVLVAALASCEPATEEAAPRPAKPRAGSPADDSLIAFSVQSRRDLQAKNPMPRVALVSLDGGEVRRLVKGSNPAWSPDGTRLAFQCHPGICTMVSDVTDLERLTKPTGHVQDEDPSWGPTGHIAFTRTYLDFD